MDGPEAVYSAHSRTGGRSSTLAAWLLAGLVAACSFGVAEAHYRALDFTEDYVFYLQAARTIGGLRTAPLTAQPWGFNAFWFSGVEGERSIHQSPHFEPVKYLYALILRVVDHPLAIALLISVVVGCPILCLFRGLLPMPCRRSTIMAIGLLYLLNPLVYLAPAYDLRTFSFLPPLFLMAVLSFLLRRPVGERLLWFNGLFLVREEAVILAPFLIALGYFGERNDDTSASGAVRHVVPFLLSWIVWTLVVALYFVWTGYPNSLLSYVTTSRHMNVGLPAYGVFLVLLWKGRRWVGLQCVVLAAAGGLVGLQWAIRFWRSGSAADVVYSPYHLLVWVIVMGAMLAWASAAPRMEGVLRKAAFVGGAALLVANAISPRAPYPTWRALKRSAVDVAVVVATARALPKDTPVLTDLKAFPAFHDFDQAYAYEWLPLSLADPRNQGFPENRRILEALLRDRIEYAVISHQTAPILEDLAGGAGVRLEVRSRGTDFTLYRITGHGRS